MTMRTMPSIQGVRNPNAERLSSLRRRLIDFSRSGECVSGSGADSVRSISFTCDMGYSPLLVEPARNPAAAAPFTAIGMPRSPGPTISTRTISPSKDAAAAGVMPDSDRVVELPAELLVHLAAPGLVVLELLPSVLGDLFGLSNRNDDDAIAVAHDHVARIDALTPDRDGHVVRVVFHPPLRHRLVDELCEYGNALHADFIDVAAATGSHDTLGAERAIPQRIVGADLPHTEIEALDHNDVALLDLRVERREVDVLVPVVVGPLRVLVRSEGRCLLLAGPRTNRQRGSGQSSPLEEGADVA